MKACPNAVARSTAARSVLLGCATSLMISCTQTNPALEDLGDNPFPPSALALDEEAVDGLVVGNRLMEAGEYDLALRAFFRAGAEQGMTADVLSAIGSANLKLGRLEQSESLLRQAVEDDPDSVPAWNNLGAVLMERGEYGEASRVFQKAFALDSGNSDDIRNNLRLAIAKRDQVSYVGPSENNEFDLVWQGNGSYLLISP
ncbi:MAG: tetratricopeptide repeat protein [Pseudomonadota bacterium]